MRFFRRGDSAGSGPDFWTWWAGARDRIAAAIESGGLDPKLIDEITKAVKRIDPRLAWELAPGRDAKHALIVTPEGDAATRPIARRWHAAAPAPDATWEYHPSRQASAEPVVLGLAGVQVNLAEMRAIASWDESRRRVDVKLWHDAFERLPAQSRQQAAFLFLDGLLGEDDVERWIGQIDVLDAPTGGRTPEELKAEVERHAAEPAGDTWVLGQGTDSRGQVVIVTADAALKRIDHPDEDQHVAIHIGIEGGGMPDDALAETLNTEQDRLEAALGEAAIFAGRTTTPGTRTLHFVAADLDRVRAGIDGWAKDAPEWRVKVDLQHDPTWEFQRDLGVR